MLNLIYQASLVLHIAGGSVGLLLFWLPMLSRKGSAEHRRSGSWYSKAMMLVAISALVLAAVLLVDPIAAKALGFSDSARQAQFFVQTRLSALFLAQLAVLLFVNLHFGSWVLRVRAQRELLRTAEHLVPLFMLLMISVLSGVMGLVHNKILLPGFAVLGLFTAISNWRYLFSATVPVRGWLLAHVRNIIPSGIAAYTAFFVVGASDWVGESQWRLLPWVLPGVIGSAVIFYYTRKLLRQSSSKGLSGLEIGELAK